MVAIITANCGFLTESREFNIMPTHHIALLSLYSAVVVMSINGIFAKAIPLGAVTITHIRCVIAVLALLAFALYQKQTLRLLHRSHYRAVVILGILMAIHWSTFFKSMQVSTVAVGMLAHYCHPVLTVIFEPLLDRKAPASTDVLAGIVVLIGIVLMVPDWTVGGDALLGVLLGLASAVAFSARNIFQRRWVSDESGSSVMFYQMLVVALVTLPFVVPLNGYVHLAKASSETWLMILALGVLTTALCHTLLAVSLRALSAKTVSLISCLQPPIAIFLGWLLLSETPLPITLAGGGLILASAAYESAKSRGKVRSDD